MSILKFNKLCSELFRNSIARAFSTSLLGIFSGLLTSLVLLRAIVMEVAVDDFSTYAIALQLTAYLSVLQMGLDFAASREIAARLGANDSLGANQAFWELHRFNRRMTGLGAIIVSLAAGGLWAWGYLIESGDNKVLMAKILFLSGLGQVVQSLARPYVAALVGSRRQPIVNVIQTLNSLITAALAYALLRLGFGVFCLPVASVILWILTYWVMRRAVALHASWRSDSPCAPDKEAFKRIFTFGGMSTLGGIAWTVESTSDIFILGLASSPTVVAAYVVWWRIPQMLFDLCTRLAFSAFPDMAHRNSKGEDEMRRLFSKVAWASFFLGSLACLGLGLWLPTFVRHWLGGLHRLDGEHLIAVLMGVLVFFRVLSNFVSLFSFSRNTLARPVVSAVIQAVVKLTLGVLLVYPFGLAGLLAASVIAASIPLFLIGVELWRNKTLDPRDMKGFLVTGLIALLLPANLRLDKDAFGIPVFVAGAMLTALAWLGVFYWIRRLLRSRSA